MVPLPGARALNIPLRRRLGTLWRRLRFPGSAAFWEARYAGGGTSGAGSYGRLARFKADVINEFVETRGIGSVIEFGCGDGNQLSLARYPRYLGLDVSPHALRRCIARFDDDPSRSFYLYDSLAFADHARLFRAELSLSLDVIYHLVEDEVYKRYMRHLFDAAERYVVIYSSDHEGESGAVHVRHRRFSDWIVAHAPDFTLIERIRNRYPYLRDADEGSFADFYLYERDPSTPRKPEP